MTDQKDFLRKIAGILAGLAALVIVTEAMPFDAKWILRAAGVGALLILLMLGK